MPGMHMYLFKFCLHSSSAILLGAYVLGERMCIFSTIRNIHAFEEGCAPLPQLQQKGSVHNMYIFM